MLTSDRQAIRAGLGLRHVQVSDGRFQHVELAVFELLLISRFLRLLMVGVAHESEFVSIGLTNGLDLQSPWSRIV
jgi:hypothetical protein